MSEKYLRKANYNDIELFYHWANDPEAQIDIFHNRQISREEYKAWFKQKIESDSNSIYVYCCENKPVGQVRIDLHEEQGWITYSVDAAYRFLGHGKIILQLLETILKKDYPEIKYLKARVKHDNIASQVIFEQLGYSKMQKASEYIEYQKSVDCFKYFSPVQTDVRGGGGGILFLTNNRNALPLYDWLCQQEPEIDVILFSEKLQIKQLELFDASIIISYNYNYLINAQIINHMNGNIINMHISFLPWNKGMHPNFWSFWDNTPNGVTIHYIDETLDTGDIIAQKRIYFDLDKKRYTLKDTYEELQLHIQNLFKENWPMIKIGSCKRILQKPHDGSFHYAKDLLPIWKVIKDNGEWNIDIQELLKIKTDTGKIKVISLEDSYDGNKLKGDDST